MCDQVYRFRLSNFSTTGLDTGLTYVMRLDFANKTKEMKVESKRKGDKHVFEVSKEMRSFEIDQVVLFFLTFSNPHIS
jgi:hypothetical protein